MRIQWAYGTSRAVRVAVKIITGSRMVVVSDLKLPLRMPMNRVASWVKTVEINVKIIRAMGRLS